MAVAEKRLEELRAKISKITKNAPVLSGEDNMIELNENNSYHKVWFEEDSYKEK
ncbi:hypothetical protein [Bacillus dakarensis]|uniref:hypothetical protein n=1 Tax=Robertmurraya dakarensis TaxID=1926278 RepID=UPI0012B6A19D|nr:hypothetical protein [Bacillus dakarensis]